MAERDSEIRWSATQALLHPAWWASLALLIVNDHLLKGSGPLASQLTGKISDFAGMVMAPAVVAVLIGARGQRRFVAAHLAVGGVFAALKLSATCAALWCGFGAALGCHWKVVSDKTDLVALPMLAISIWLFGPRAEARGALRSRWRQTITLAAEAIGLLSILATSRPPPRTPVLTPTSVYVGEGDDLIELDRATGAQRRVVDFDLGGYARLRIVGDSLYATSGDILRAWELSSGRLKWEKKSNGGWLEIVKADEKKLVVESDEAITAFDPSSGQLLWQVLSPITSSVAMTDRVAALRWAGPLAFYGLSDGRPLARTTLPEGTLLAVHEGALYALTRGALLELDALGAVRRRAQEPLISARWASQHFPAKNLLVNTHAREASEKGAELVSLDSGDFRVRWRLPGGQVVEATEKLVFTVQGDTCNGGPPLAARDAASGRVLWSTPWCGSSSLAADETIVVSYSRVGAMAWDAMRGSLRWSVNLDD